MQAYDSLFREIVMVVMLTTPQTAHVVRTRTGLMRNMEMTQ